MTKLLKYCRQFLEYVENNLREGEVIEFLSKEENTDEFPVVWYDDCNRHVFKGLRLYTRRIEKEYNNIYEKCRGSIVVKFNKEYYIFEFYRNDVYGLEEIFKANFLEEEEKEEKVHTTDNQQETPKETSKLLSELLEQYKEVQKQIEEEDASMRQPETDSYRKKEELIEKILKASPIQEGDVVYCTNDESQTLCKVDFIFVQDPYNNGPHVRACLRKLFGAGLYTLSINTDLLVKQPQHLDCSC